VIRLAVASALLCATAAAAAPLPALGRTPAQLEWSQAELRGLWTRASRRIERFRRHADSPEAAEKLSVRLFAGELDYTPVRDERGDLSGLVLSDARSLAVSESDLRSYLGAGRGGAALLAGLGLTADPSTAEALGRELAVYDLALTRLARELCPSERGTACLERASRALRPGVTFSVPMMDDEESVAAKGEIAPALSLEYAQWQLAEREKKGSGAWRGWPGAPLKDEAARRFLTGFVARHAERLWRRAQSRMGPRHPWIYGSTMADAVSRTFPWSRGAGGEVLFFPAGRAPLSVGKEAEPLLRGALEPWKALAAELGRAPATDLAPLSPYAAEELAEMVAVMAGHTLARARAPTVAGLTEAAAVWDGAFSPPPSSSAPAAWFREIPAEASGLALPFPEPPRHSWEAPGEMPGGLAVLDFDRDGRPDLFVCDFEQAQLHRNLGGLRFENATAAAGLSGLSCANGASSADFDGDGWPDLLVLHDRLKRDLLFRNRGGRFVDETLDLGLSTAARNGTSAVWLDYDRDGRLDLFVVEAQDYRQQVEDIGELRTGGPDHLYRGVAGGFEEVTSRAGLGDAGWGLAAVAFDYDGDGWTDLDVLNDFGVNRLYRNQRDGTFRDASREAGVDSLGNGMGVSAADYDHDGDLDLFVTYPGADRPATRYLFPAASRVYRLPYSGYFSGGTRYRQRDRLFRNNGDGSFADAYLEEMDDVPTGWGWNGFFFDADNRGWQDVFQVSGWWPDQLAYSDQTMVFWRWDPAARRFRDASEESGLDFAGDARSSAYADFDGDGCLDVVATGFSPVRLFAGSCTRSHHWLAVRLVGTRSNRDGFGAKVVVRAGDLTQTAEMGAQGGGFQSSLPPEVRFGLGAAERADSVEVVWPGGRRQRLEGVAADRTVVISEEAP